MNIPAVPWEEFMKKLPGRSVLLIIILGIVSLVVIYFSQILEFFSVLWKILLPLVIGVGLAYVMELIRFPLDRLIFPQAKSGFPYKIKQVLLIAIILLFLLAFVALLLSLIIPSVTKTITIFASSLPTVFERLRSWIMEHRNLLPSLADKIDPVTEFSVPELIQLASGYFPNKGGTLLNITGNFISITFSTIYTVIMSTIFALYVIYNKKKLKKQAVSLIRMFFSSHSKPILYCLRTANDCFRSYITSQAIQAVILTAMCILGMLIFGFPEPVMIGIFMGATSLIPLLGSYIGGAACVLIVLAMNPSLALWFLLFILIVQQIVGNVIYPKVAGRQFGLPGLWVLASVMVGGGLFGVIGMIVGVPISATMYQLLKKYNASLSQRSSTAPKDKAEEPSSMS